ncbi:MAG: Rieske (2Fe-2S) protein [Planctomycetota bacterium]
MCDFESVGNVDDFEIGVGRAVPVAGRMVAIFRNADGTWNAIDDLCPHMGASLAEGYYADKAVSCPWHAWRFSVTDGTWDDNPKIKVDCFEIKVEGDEVFVREPED